MRVLCCVCVVLYINCMCLVVLLFVFVLFVIARACVDVSFCCVAFALFGSGGLVLYLC